MKRYPYKRYAKFAGNELEQKYLWLAYKHINKAADIIFTSELLGPELGIEIKKIQKYLLSFIGGIKYE